MKDNEIWLCFMTGALAINRKAKTRNGAIITAATRAARSADDALEEYRKRWGKQDIPNPGIDQGTGNVFNDN